MQNKKDKRFYSQSESTKGHKKRRNTKIKSIKRITKTEIISKNTFLISNTFQVEGLQC